MLSTVHRKEIIKTKQTNRTRWYPEHGHSDTKSKTKGRRWYVNVSRSGKHSLYTGSQRAALSVGLVGLRDTSGKYLIVKERSKEEVKCSEGD